MPSHYSKHLYGTHRPVSSNLVSINSAEEVLRN